MTHATSKLFASHSQLRYVTDENGVILPILKPAPIRRGPEVAGRFSFVRRMRLQALHLLDLMLGLR